VKVRKRGLLGLGLFLLVILLLSIFTWFLDEGNKVGNSPGLQEKKEVSLEEANAYLESYHTKVGFYNEVGESLRAKGYEHSLLGIMESEDEFQIKIILLNKEANKLEQKEVKKIFEETAIKFKLEPKTFKVHVSNGKASAF